MDRNAYGVIASFLREKITALQSVKNWEDYQRINRDEIKNAIQKFIADLKTSTSDFPAASPYAIAEPPAFTSGMTHEDFREALYKHLMLFKEPALMLQKLNEVQQGVPFVLVYGGKEPSPAIAYGSRITYGLGDLFRFLHLLNKDTPVMSEMKIKGTSYNPFYAPIKYPIPTIDFSFNEMLQICNQRFNRHEVLPPIEELFRLTSSMEEKKYYKTVVENYRSIMKKLLELVEGLLDPTFLSKMIPGQERPVEKWEQDNFNMLVSQFLQRHSLQELLEKKTRKTVSMVPHDLGQLAKKYDKAYYK
jgi:hypothetical protein